jgi:hypothetical protein
MELHLVDCQLYFLCSNQSIIIITKQLADIPHKIQN